MASKASTNRKSIASGLTVKYVKKAQMWCATFPQNGKTVQKWFDKDPTSEQLAELKESMNVQA